jgi:hypothetical protein
MLLVGSDFSFVTQPIRRGQPDQKIFEYLDKFIEILNKKSSKFLGINIKA